MGGRLGGGWRRAAWAAVQPIWDVAGQTAPSQRSLTKADPIFVECLKVPAGEKMSFRLGNKKKSEEKKNAGRLFEIFNQSRRSETKKQGCRGAEIPAFLLLLLLSSQSLSGTWPA